MFKFGIRFRNICGTWDETILKGQTTKGGLHDAAGKSMTGEGLGAGNFYCCGAGKTCLRALISEASPIGVDGAWALTYWMDEASA